MCVYVGVSQSFPLSIYSLWPLAFYSYLPPYLFCFFYLIHRLNSFKHRGNGAESKVTSGVNQCRMGAITMLLGLYVDDDGDKSMSYSSASWDTRDVV